MDGERGLQNQSSDEKSVVEEKVISCRPKK